MRAEIIAIGDELTSGQRLDTNSQWLSERLGEIANRYGVTVFDVHTITKAELPSHPEYFSADGFHPSDQGYELWASAMWPTVARVIGE